MTTLTGVAKSDTATTNAVGGIWINLTSNDSTAYGPLTVTGVDLTGTKGTASLVPGSTNGVWYSPGAAFRYLSVGQSATDTFTYTETDRQGDTATATVTVTVNGVEFAPTANSDKATTDSQHGVWLSLVRNDTDPNRSDRLSVVSVNQTGTLGSVGLNPTATNGAWYMPGTAFNYLSVGETATDHFTYTISDGHGGTSTATATVTVTGVNLPPTANPDLATTDSQHGMWINLTGNDTDPNHHDILGVAALNLTGTKGTPVITGAGANGVWYSPGSAFNYLGAGQTATDTFGYTVSDGHGGTSTAQVTVTVTGVNLPPVAHPDAAATDAQDKVTINLLAAAADPNQGDVLSVAALDTTGTLGTVSLDPGTPGSVIYSPGAAFDYLSTGETATDTFGYTVSDGHGGTASSTATVTITGVNLPPVANPDAAATDAQHGVWINLTANDTDPNRHDVVTITGLDLSGTLGAPTFSGGSSNGVWYSPGTAFDYLSVGETATDTFAYTISDGHGGTATAPVTVTITGANLPPVASPDYATTDAQDAVSLNLLANDSDPNQDDILSVTSLDTSSTQGTVTLNPDGTVLYSPGTAFGYLSAGETATDSFGYTISDGHGGTATSYAQVTVTGVNTPPVAAPFAATTDADHGMWLNLMGSVTDANRHDTVTVTSVNTSGAQGTISFDPNSPTGVYYTPSSAFQSLTGAQTATDTFTYTVADNHGGTTTGTATVTIDANGAFTVPGKAFYVATNGNDSWSGRLAQPNADGTDGPFATLGAAQKAMEADLTTQTTYVEGGDYYLPAQLTLTAADSGQTWSAYAGQTVAIHGGTPLTGWTNQGGGIWAVQLPAGAMADGAALDTLSVHGVAQTDARFPVATPGVPSSGWLTATASLPGENTGTQFQFAPGSIPTFANTSGLYALVFTQNGWSDVISPVSSINYATGQITLANQAPYPVGAGSRFYLFNTGQPAAPGEYAYDPKTHVLTYNAPAGFDGTGAVIGNDPQVVGIYGAQNITLSGLTLGDAQTGSVGVQIDSSSNITVQNSIVQNAGTGFELGGSSNVKLLGNTLRNLGDSGIVILPGSNSVTVNGNTLQNIGALTSGNGIWFTGSSNDVISNNVLQNIAKVGIGGGSVLGSSDASHNDVITHNTISNANQQTGDAGGIYLLSRQQDMTGDTISFNTVANTSAWVNGSVAKPTAGIGTGIYLDDFTSGVNVYGNLLQGNVDGIWLHLGWNNTINHNVIASTLINSVSMDGGNFTGIPSQHAPTGNVFENNTVYLDQPNSLADAIYNAVADASWVGNTYGGPALGAKPFIIDVAHATIAETFAQWQALGFDTAASGSSIAAMTLAQALARLPTS